MPKEVPLLKISISGPTIRPGRIAIPILLKLCQEAQAAVNRQAISIEAKKSDKPAPDLLLRECALELIGLKRGSTTLEFAPANKQMSLFPELASARIDAVSAVATTLRDVNQKRGKWRPPDPRVLDTLDELGGLFSSGVNKLKWIVPRQNGHKGARAEFVPAPLNKVKRRKQKFLDLEGPAAVQAAGPIVPSEAVTPGAHPVALQTPSVQESFLEGLLEAGEGKVRITPTFGAPATIRYSADKADSVLEAVHKPVRVRVDPKSRTLVDIEVTASGAIDTRLFWIPKSTDQIVAEQSVQVVADVNAFRN